MTRLKWLLCAFLLTFLWVEKRRLIPSQPHHATPTMCSQPSTPPLKATPYMIPTGTCTWTSGVTISGKGIIVQGAGSGRIIAYSADTLTISAGTKTINIAGYSPTFSGSSFIAGQTMTLYATGNESDFMIGTVTSYSGGVLTMNIISTGGSGSTHRWLIATPPTTVLVNNSATPIFSVTEDTSFHTNLSGFKIQVGAGAGDGVDFNYNSSGIAIVLHDCWIPQGAGDLCTPIPIAVLCTIARLIRPPSRWPR